MFDFMKDLYFEVNGYDMDMIRKEREQQIEKEKKETIIFKKQTKKILLVFGILFLIISLGAFYISMQQSEIYGIIKNAFLIILDIFTIICMLIRKKCTEMASLVGMLIIVFITFVLPAI